MLISIKHKVQLKNDKLKQIKVSVFAAFMYLQVDEDIFLICLCFVFLHVFS